MMTVRTIIATAALIATTAMGPAACDPATKSEHPTAPTPTSSATSTAEQCEPDWVCGTCPDGSTWGYLNDPKYLNDPVIGKLIFDPNHPCG
jgi:hypothetical protein